MFWRYMVLLTLALIGLGLPAQLDAFVARSTACHHNGTWYADKSMVPTTAKCLSCLCNKKSLVCRLKVCPEMPMPPPRGCVVVQKKNSCCPYLSCARLDAFYKLPTSSRIIAYLDHYERESIDRVVNENVLQRRSDDSEVDLYVCVKNGTVYKSGSAMSSSNLCTYCYCIGGSEKCVKPKCMLPVDGCKPIFVDSTCCPVRYDCTTKTSGKSSQETRYRKTSNKHFQRMSQRLQRNRGCTIGKQFYGEGQKMKSDLDKPCDICFCIRGTRRCAPKKCAPSLKNCSPVVPKGQCCPSSYDCGSQRDYRRAHNSRQFNLFSLLFGPEEAPPNGTDIPVEYPHDRHPAMVATKRPTTAVSATSEKSIFDTLREGLEFIDSNNQELSENIDMLALSSTDKPNVSSTTTEVSFLDLLLGPSESSAATDVHDIPEEKTTANYESFSWMDLLLGTDEDAEKNIVHTTASQTTTNNVVEAESTSTDFSTDYGTFSIDRLGDDFDDFSGSGEIIVDDTTTFDTTTENAESTTELDLAQSTLHAVETTEEYDTTEKTTTEPLPTTTNIWEEDTTTETTIVLEKPTQAVVQASTKTIMPDKLKKKTAEKLHKTDSIALKEPTPPPLKHKPAEHKPINNGSLMSALIDGIAGMLKNDRPVIKTDQKVKNNTKLTQSKPTTSKSTQRPIKLPTTKPLPSFKPLPTHKPHTRINSKIANLTMQHSANKHAANITFKPLPSRVKRPPTTTSTPTTLKETMTPSTTTSTTSISTTTTTTSTTTAKALTTTTSTSTKPVYVKTNPTILESEPIDENSSHTLPPSLPNLKIIPFLPTDAVQADHNQLVYDYYHGMSKNSAQSTASTMAPPLLIDGHWDTVATSPDKDSTIDYDSYGDGKIYPSITEQYHAYPDIEDGSKAEYIYKFDVEGPSSSVSSSAGKMSGTAAAATAFVKFDFAAPSNGFSPPTKTEGGFMPKDPLIMGNEDNAAKDKSYQITPHIIDITTAETTKIIEITTPDPFKDVIHTESPPDLTSLIGDKDKILSAQHSSQYSPTNITSYSHYNEVAPNNEIIIHITTEIPENNNIDPSIRPSTITSEKKVNKTLTLDDMILKDKNSIESFLDLLFQDEEPVAPKSTIPPFKALPQTDKIPYTTKASIKHKSITTTTTKKPIPKTSASTTSNKNTEKRKKIRPTHSTTTTTYKPVTFTPKNSTNTRTIPSRVTSKITTTTSTPITTTTSSAKTTLRPILMAPFDKLPFMDASFEVRLNSAHDKTTHTPTANFLGVVNYKSSLNEHLENPSSTLASMSSTTSSTTTEKQIPSLTNNLVDPSGNLKLAGCNIYGRMYRVGRIILELSSACLECKCTEIGVKCGPLDC